MCTLWSEVAKFDSSYDENMDLWYIVSYEAFSSRLELDIPLLNQ